MLITREMLVEHGACEKWLEIFSWRCPDGLYIKNKQDIVDAVILGGFGPVINWVVKLGVVEELDFSHSFLSDAFFRFADLRRSNFNRANLHYSDLRDSDLRGASLRGANLSDACLCKADLSYADLTHANLSNADLRGANLQDARLPTGWESVVAK